jgi:putative protease
MASKIKNPEILAPVGHIDAFYSAISAGCDAVYLGGLQFGARDYAKNFDHETLAELVRYAHLRDVRVYYTLNTLIKDIEFEQLHKELEFLDTLCLDALIIQDLGVFEYIRTYFPTFILHGSTQLNIHNVEDARFFYDLGFERIVLARECSLTDVASIIERVPIEVETFVHGALCYSFSGQCLMSSFYGGRSGNRGKCAGPCRLPFTINDQSGYYLSMKDQMTLEILPQLILAGIDSFKIEGRMKNADYVFYATYLYRKYRALAIECIQEERIEDYRVLQEDIDLLKIIYNRGDFTQGYYFSHPQSQISVKHPKHLGLHVGSAQVTGKTISLDLDEKLHQGDVIEWHVPSVNLGEVNHPTSTLETDWTQRKILLNKNLPIVKKIITLDGVKNATIQLYKIFDPMISKGIDALKEERHIDVQVRVMAKVGKPLHLDMNYKDIDDKSYSFSIDGFVVEEAQKRPLDEDTVKKQFNKTEDSIFVFKFEEMTIDGHAFVPIGAMNQLRRDALLLLENNKLDLYWKKRVPYQLKNLMGRQTKAKDEIEGVNRERRLRILVSSYEQWEGLKESYKKKAALELVDRIYVDSTDMSIDKINVILKEKESFEDQTKIYLALPHVLFPASKQTLIEALDRINISAVDGFLIRSLGQIHMLASYNKPIASDYNIHAFNQWSTRFLYSNVETVTLSVELNARGMEDILDKILEMDCEWIAYGHIGLMHSSTCAYKSRYGRCDYSTDGHHLHMKDRKQESLHVTSHCKYCYNSIYNAKATNLLDYRQQLKGKYRIEYTYESKEEVIKLMDLLYQGKPPFFDESKMTKGHIQRGVK